MKKNIIICCISLSIIILVIFTTWLSNEVDIVIPTDTDAVISSPTDTVDVSSTTDNDTNSFSLADTNEYVIKAVHVKEQSLSHIDINEENQCESSVTTYFSGEPWIDENGNMCFMSADNFLYYDVDKDKFTNTGIHWDEFDIKVMRDGILYGIQSEYVHEYLGYEYFITKHENGKFKKVLDSPVQGSYFTDEGIYYQISNRICLMDYNGQNIKLILEIPDELYYEDCTAKFIIYRNKLWYCHYDSDRHNNSFWCYDFNGTFTKFDKGDLESANNGFIYYRKNDSEYHSNLYRFNCETYTVELVSDADIMGYSFYDGYILYSTFNDLYKMNFKVNSKIFTADKLGNSDSFTTVLKSEDGRIFVMGSFDPSYYCLAEIDIDGNIVSIIYEDEVS